MQLPKKQGGLGCVAAWKNRPAAPSLSLRSTPPPPGGGGTAFGPGLVNRGRGNAAAMPTQRCQHHFRLCRISPSPRLREMGRGEWQFTKLAGSGSVTHYQLAGSLDIGEIENK